MVRDEDTAYDEVINDIEDLVNKHVKSFAVKRRFLSKIRQLRRLLREPEEY